MFFIDRRKSTWSDGPSGTFHDFMGREGAPPVACRHLCSGDDGEDAPTPDVQQYIDDYGEWGRDFRGRGDELYDDAKQTGIELKTLGRDVSGKAGRAADQQQDAYGRMMRQYRGYAPLYEARLKDAMSAMGDMAAYETDRAGAAASDAGMRLDASLEAKKREMAGLGIPPSAYAGGLDVEARTQRAMAQTAAASNARLMARGETRNLAAGVLGEGERVAGVATGQAGLAQGNRGIQLNAPIAASGAANAAYNPALAYHGLGADMLRGQGQLALGAGGLELETWKAQQENSDGGFMGTVAPMAMGIGGSFIGGMGGPMGTAIGKSMVAAEGGHIPEEEDNYVSPEESPSGGQEIDDVQAMLSEGEFVIPKRTVDWYGEKFFQNLVMKADKERGQETVAEPSEGPAPAGISAMPPMFRSEGART